MIHKFSNVQEKNQYFIARIKKYLTRKGHDTIFSIYIENYNKINLYISFDYVKKVSAYKITWFDLNFIDNRKLSDYQNSQFVSKKLALNIVDAISKINIDEEIQSDDSIIGDRIYLFLNKDSASLTYGFTRFLPLEWEAFIDPIVIIFSYLPRNMDILLQELFAIFDGTTDIFTYTKPIKYDLLKSNPNPLFSRSSIELGTKFYTDSRVLYLEEIEEKYFAIVEDEEPYFVILNQVDKDHAMLWCNCKKGYLCHHIYAALLALHHKSFKKFYKVRYNTDEMPLLEKIMYGNVYLCYGVSNDKILLIDLYGNLIHSNIVKNNRCLFDVIEDDDECSLSKYLDDFKKN